MNSPLPRVDDIIDALGDKVSEAIPAAIVQTRVDLRTYRASLPSFVAEHSERGLLNWLHDRLWINVQRELDDVSHVTFRDVGPTREMWVHDRFRIRFKKHDIGGVVRAYPTDSVLFFMSQELGVLEGMQEVHLVAGYVYDADDREVGQAVLSLHADSTARGVRWVHQFDEPDEQNLAATEPLQHSGDPAPARIERPAATQEDDGS